MFISQHTEVIQTVQNVFRETHKPLLQRDSLLSVTISVWETDLNANCIIILIHV